MQRYTSDVANIGRWDTIHNIAANADQVNNLPTKRAYASVLSVIVDRHYCQECRSHGIDWLNRNPPHQYFNRADGCLYHSWLFHDSVNRRLRKPSVPYNMVRQWYAPVIMNGCSVAHDAITGQPVLNVRR